MRVVFFAVLMLLLFNGVALAAVGDKYCRQLSSFGGLCVEQTQVDKYVACRIVDYDRTNTVSLYCPPIKLAVWDVLKNDLKNKR